MTEPFWTFIHCSWGSNIRSPASTWWFNFIDKSSYLRAPEGETSSQAIGQFFLSWAYSTPAGVAYRLTYGVPKP